MRCLSYFPPVLPIAVFAISEPTLGFFGGSHQSLDLMGTRRVCVLEFRCLQLSIQIGVLTDWIGRAPRGCAYSAPNLKRVRSCHAHPSRITWAIPNSAVCVIESEIAFTPSWPAMRAASPCSFRVG